MPSSNQPPPVPHPAPHASAADFLLGPGEVRALMRTHDWSTSSLGAPAGWPAELVFLVRLMLDSAFPAFVAWGDQLGFLYNDSYARILGAKHPSALGRDFASIWGEIWDDISPIIDKALAGHSSYFEDRPLTILRGAHPERTWFTFSYSPVYCNDGNVGGIYCTCNETTDKVLALQRQAFRYELSESLRDLNSVEDIEQSAIALLGKALEMDAVFFAAVDDDTHRFTIRSSWTAEAPPNRPAVPRNGNADDYGDMLLGLLRGGHDIVVDEVASHPVFGPFAAEYAAIGIAAILIVPLIKEGRLVTTLNVTRAHAHAWSEHDISLARHVAEYAWAVTERVRAEQAKRDSEVRYGTLIDIVDEGFAIVELVRDGSDKVIDYRFLEVNPAFEKQSGMRDVLGKTLVEAAPHVESSWIELGARVAQSGVAERIEQQARSTGKWFSLYASRLDLGDQRRLALLFSDISARKFSEEALRRSAAELSEADRRKTEFLATLAHELRNPLAPLRTGLEVMRLSAASPQTVARVRDMMGRQISHMVRLIDDLLDIARISSGKVVLRKELADLCKVLANAVETSLPAIEDHHHHLTVQVPDHPVMAEIDAVRIEQVIGNLLTNAAKYTPEGGKIAISLDVGSEAILIRVSDTGVGIAGEALPMVFDMFAQVGEHIERSRGGLGIGLAIVHRLVAMHGGAVLADSPGLDQGSTFTISLPLAQTPAQLRAAPQLRPGASASAGTPAAGGPLRILLADDNVDAADMLGDVLRMSGHHVSLAHDGSAALQQARQHPPDVAILDIGMPGLTGHEVARALRADPATAGITLVALTGWGASDDRARTFEAGFDHHLTKPVEQAALQEILGRLG